MCPIEFVLFRYTLLHLCIVIKFNCAIRATQSLKSFQLSIYFLPLIFNEILNTNKNTNPPCLENVNKTSIKKQLYMPT